MKVDVLTTLKLFINSWTICIFLPDLLQRDGLFNLLVVVRIFPAGWKLLERLREKLTLVVPGTPHSLIQLEDWVTYFYIRTLGLWLSFIIANRAWKIYEVLIFIDKKARSPVLLPHMLLLTRENRVILTFWAVMKRYTDTREPITLPRPAISKQYQKTEKYQLKRHHCLHYLKIILCFSLSEYGKNVDVHINTWCEG